MDDYEGVKTAAKRRADFELGLKLDARKIHHLTRILYSSNCSETLAENELDHCVLSFGSMVPNKPREIQIQDENCTANDEP